MLSSLELGRNWPARRATAPPLLRMDLSSLVDTKRRPVAGSEPAAFWLYCEKEQTFAGEHQLLVLKATVRRKGKTGDQWLHDVAAVPCLDGIRRLV